MSYTTIVADPPWRYGSPGQIGKTLEHRPNRDRGESRHGAGSHARYGSMSIEEIKQIGVSRIASDNAHLYLWTTNAFVCEAHDVARDWGFEPKSFLTWVKLKKSSTTDNPEPSMKMGYYFRGATEHVVFAVRGSLKTIGPAMPTAFFSHRLPHSVKPSVFYRMVERKSPGPRIELFARERRDGWDCWGDEVKGDVSL